MRKGGGGVRKREVGGEVLPATAAPDTRQAGRQAFLESLETRPGTVDPMRSHPDWDAALLREKVSVLF